jgi:hypothetical protein
MRHRRRSDRLPHEKEPPVSLAEAQVLSVLSASAAAATATSWRPLGRRLWVGRTAAGPVGSIERGRRFVATDVEGRPLGGYRSLDAAMAAFEVQAGADEPADARSWEALALVTTLAGAAGSLLAMYALISI